MAFTVQNIPIYFKKQEFYLKQRRLRSAQIPIMTAAWTLHTNGSRETLITHVSRNGLVTGSVHANPVRGWYDKRSGKITFVRYIPGGTINGINNQLYEGYIQKSALDSGITLTGTFVTVGDRASAQSTTFSWFAEAIILV
ncbi:hypothetical protein GCM10008018_59960 [Paenibacillus marchantiophytorum]|uniref:Uncharacterized protein n=1 Tax=Paenibacillus marchantiophytorum TaxID=1619310 RepID=A0ABQ1FC27_9BACL|nr:hypothetical protein [Paenibacillus marchantiophytorum]GGA06023.1 hypothetical protein GCM10008018_59960 [Paenibacillus marchantiophytorum]